MRFETNLRKMRSSLDVNGTGMAVYHLPLYHVTEYAGEVEMNSLIGQPFQIRFSGCINCIETGKKIKKTYGEGLCFDAFMTSPSALPSIIRPELSRIHEGIALRNREWEEEHHNCPHYVYLSRTSDIKIGVTRTTNIPSRWIDQGAAEAVIVAQTPYRQLAGLFEVNLKQHIPDKTHWQNMLRNVFISTENLCDRKNSVLGILPEEYEPFFHDDDTVITINYPVLRYPEKVKAMKLDSTADYCGRLTGIKGQYLIFEDGTVLNIRGHAGYRVLILTGEDCESAPAVVPDVSKSQTNGVIPFDEVKKKPE